MLGRHKMTHDGTATVVRCQLTGGLRAAADVDVSFAKEHSLNHDLILDVAPDGASAFRAETRMRFGVSHTPRVGDTLRVRCDPEHKRVEIDISEDARFNWRLYEPAEEAERENERERLLAEPPSAPTPTGDDIKRLLEERRRERGL